MVINPADGERNAIRGFIPQYRISASLILRHLREKNLKWIKIADPAAGRVDDFQMCRHSQIDAYQVKWSTYPNNFTLNDLVKKSQKKPSLIFQLAEGWLNLREKYPDFRIVVHLITNNTATSSGGIPKEEIATHNRHFAGFIEQCWKPLQNKTLDFEWKVPQDWRKTWEIIRAASGLPEEQFKTFVCNCRLEFRYSLPIDKPTTLEQQTFKKDIDHITTTLFDAVIDPQHIVKLDLEELLIKLGWKDRFEYKSLHEFPVNEEYY